MAPLDNSTAYFKGGRYKEDIKTKSIKQAMADEIERLEALVQDASRLLDEGRRKLHEVQQANPLAYSYSDPVNGKIMAVTSEYPNRKVASSQWDITPLYAFPEVMKLPDTVKTWEHKKTGGLYRIVGSFQIEATNRPGLLYRSMETATVWGRDSVEFLDGRFRKKEDL